MFINKTTQISKNAKEKVDKFRFFKYNIPRLAEANSQNSMKYGV